MLKSFHIFYLCLYSLIGLYRPADAAQSVPATVRVALAKDVAQVTLQGTALVCTAAPTVPPLPNPSLAVHGSTTVTAAGGGIYVGQQFFPTARLLCRATQGQLFVNQLPIDGPLHLFHADQEATRLTAVVTIPLEKYLLGVVAGEMQASWPQAALQAQAVAARSYVLAKLRETPAHQPYDVLASVEDQVYQPSFHVPASIQQAVDSTAGQVVTLHAQPVKTYFHSCCGGRTATAASVWGAKAAQPFRPIRDPYCAKSKHSQWHVHLSRDHLATRLEQAGYITPPIRDLHMEIDRDTGRVAHVEIQTASAPLTLAANTFRSIVGYGDLKSVWFASRRNGQGWQLQGHGFGHGVGLCQWGAKGRADKGKNYLDILSFYYPGTAVERIY